MEPKNINVIETLLERYFEGATSLDQERELREYFRGGRVPEHLEYARAMFGGIDRAAAEEPSAAFVAPRERSMAPGRRIAAWGAAAAACAGIAVALLSPGSSKTVYCYVDGRPVTDREQARQHTHTTLDFVARSFDASMSRAADVESIIDALIKTNI